MTIDNFVATPDLCSGSVRVSLRIDNTGGEPVTLYLFQRKMKEGQFASTIIASIAVGKNYVGTQTLEDFLVASGSRYQYSIDGARYVSNIVSCNFRSIFIAEYGEVNQSIGAKYYKLNYDTTYASHQRNQQVALFEPLQRKYPIMIKNSHLNYETGGVSTRIVGNTRQEITASTREINDFLTNGKPKLLKDWNGNVWIIGVSENINIGYSNGTGMSYPMVEFNWTEIGSVFDDDDLKTNGFFREIITQQTASTGVE